MIERGQFELDTVIPRLNNTLISLAMKKTDNDTVGTKLVITTRDFSKLF